MKLLQYAFVVFCFVTMISCDALSGNKDLGDNFYLFGGDHDNREILLYCSSYEITCMGGTPLVPRSEDLEVKYVSKVNFDDDSVIAEMTNLKKEKTYWIVIKKPFENYKNCDFSNCDSIIKNNVLGPFTREIFLNEKQRLNCSLDFE